MEKSKTNRQVWIDNARAFAMIAVVWMHTVNIGLKDVISYGYLGRAGGGNLQGIIVYPLCIILLTGLSLLMVSIFKQNDFLSFIFSGKINKKTYEL